MKNLRLAALNLDIFVPDSTFYFDDGYVESLDVHTSFLDWKHKTCGKDESQINPGYNYIGRTSLYVNPSGRFVYVYYLRCNDAWSDMRNRAHEETHALDNMDGLEFLQRKLDEYGFDVNLHDHDDETRACIGGWFSYISCGWHLEEHRPFNDIDKRAFRLLKESQNDSDRS